MKFKNRFFIVALLCGLYSQSIAYANMSDHSYKESGEGRQRWGERMEKRFQETMNQLNITEDQKKALEANKKENRDKMKSVFQKMRTLRDDLKNELMQPNLDMNKINNIQAQLKAVQSEMSDHRLTSILEVRKILTPEQFQKFISLTDKHKGGKFSGEEK